MDLSAYGTQTTAAAERGVRQRAAVNYDEHAPPVADEYIPEPELPVKKQRRLAFSYADHKPLVGQQVATATSSDATAPEEETKTQDKPKKKPKKRPINGFKASEPKSQIQQEAESVLGYTRTPQHLAYSYANMLESFDAMARSKADDHEWHEIFAEPFQRISNVIKDLEEIVETGVAPRAGAAVKQDLTKPPTTRKGTPPSSSP